MAIPASCAESNISFNVLDTLPILAYRRLTEMEPENKELAQAFDTLLKRSPLLLCNEELAMICKKAFLPRNASRSKQANELINIAREKLKATKHLNLSKDDKIRKAHLIFYSKYKMHKVLARHFKEAAPYFEKLGKHQRNSSTCIISLRSFSHALKKYSAAGKSIPKAFTVEDIYKELLKFNLLLPPQDGSKPLSCPLSKIPYKVIREGTNIGIDCETHTTSVGLIHALSSPFTFAEDKHWHEKNAVIFARTLWARRLNSPVCLENIKILFWGLERYKNKYGSFPEGTVIDVVEVLIEKDCYPGTMMPLCPMNGRPYVIKLPKSGNPQGVNIGCTNHGWMPTKGR